MTERVYNICEHACPSRDMTSLFGVKKRKAAYVLGSDPDEVCRACRLKIYYHEELGIKRLREKNGNRDRRNISCHGLNSPKCPRRRLLKDIGKERIIVQRIQWGGESIRVRMSVPIEENPMFGSDMPPESVEEVRYAGLVV